MHGHRAAVAAMPVDGRGERPRRVDHEQIAGAQEAGQVGEPGMSQSVGRGNQQPDAVAGLPGLLGWPAGREPHDCTFSGDWTVRSSAR